MNIYRKARTGAAAVLFAMATLLLLDYTGALRHYFGWVARVQLVPALLALNLAAVVALLALALLLGRLYCSVICPLGVYQDIVARLGRRRKRHTATKPLNWLRYSFLGLFVVLILAGFTSLAGLLDPYSAFGRMASELLQPLYKWANNALAHFAEQRGAVLFYSVDVYVKGAGTLAAAIATLAVVTALALRGGRTYCNAVCPVGTLLGLASRFALIKVRLDSTKCGKCRKCERGCKASCIDINAQSIDHSRCVACFACLDACHQGALRYGIAPKGEKRSGGPRGGDTVDTGRRAMLAVGATLAAGAAATAQHKTVDGGLALIIDKKAPKRQTGIKPAGAQSHKNFEQRCTACQLCVSACPSRVLRPSASLSDFMQPGASYERGYCRPECTRCSEACPTGAIRPITREEKSSTQIGHAVWVERLCIAAAKGVTCGNCARHCPTGAITMVDREGAAPGQPQIPAVNTERCIGCGACEYLCPARPYSAIYVEGHLAHRTI